MRLIIAAVLFFVCLFAVTSLIVAVLPANAPEWMTGIALLVGIGCSLFLANKLANAPGTDFLGRPHAAETPEQLEQDGMLRTTEFRAIRAFQVEESKDEGSHFFIELSDGPVLYLAGRYLHEHEPIEFDGKTVQPREFPCTEFTIRRRRDDGSVVDVQCGGRVLEPEVVTPPFEEHHLHDKPPQDGDIITDRTYDEVKAAMSGQRRTGM